MTNLDKSLSKIFGVEPLQSVGSENLPATIPENAVVVADPHAADAHAVIDADADFVKHKLRGILENGEMAFEHLALLAKSEERVSAFDALTNMMGQLSSIAMGILDTEGKRQKLKSGVEAPVAAPTVNNNTQNNTTVFVGTTADLQKMLDVDDDVYDVDSDESDDETKKDDKE